RDGRRPRRDSGSAGRSLSGPHGPDAAFGVCFAPSGMKLNIVFMGSPEFAVPCLDALLSHHHVLAVVTQPDKPSGRGLGLAPPAVEKRALAAGVPVLQPPTVRRAPFTDELRGLDPELIVVVAF